MDSGDSGMDDLVQDVAKAVLRELMGSEELMDALAERVARRMLADTAAMDGFMNALRRRAAQELTEAPLGLRLQGYYRPAVVREALKEDQERAREARRATERDERAVRMGDVSEFSLQKCERAPELPEFRKFQSEVYKVYTVWCESQSLSPFTQHSFSRKFNAIMPPYRRFKTDCGRGVYVNFVGE